MTTVSRPDLSAELNLDDLLELLREYRWTLHIFGPAESPDVIAATQQWRNGQTDVFLLRDEHSASAYRAPQGAAEFAPSVVVWQYHSTPTWTLRAALTLPAPYSLGAPRGAQPAHPLCTVPDSLRGRRTIRRSGLHQPPGWSWF